MRPRRYYMRYLGGREYPASERLVNVRIELRGDLLVIFAGESALAGTPFSDFENWMAGRASAGEGL